MSGYAGIISLDDVPPDRDLLRRIAATLAFRGPDATRITAQSNAGFVFTFLRTGPAPQSAAQPCTLDNRVWFIGDVRLDGRGDLRRKLEQHGTPVLSSATDEELVLHAWQNWGEPAFPRFLGDFGVALWDSTTRQLLCVRDFLGSKPFYYVHTDSQFAFSNTLAALRLLPKISSTLDPIFIADFLLQEWSADPARTAFRDIHRVPPGHALRFDATANTLRVHRYTSLPMEDLLVLKDPQDYIDQFRSLLVQAIADRIPDAPTAIFMSGGLDSTVIAAIAVTNSASRKQSLDLRAFTADYKPLFLDNEDLYAKLIAKKFSIPIEVFSPASSLPYENCNSFAPPEPIHDPFSQANLLQYRRIAAYSRVILSGYGGDDILIGQAWPHLLNLLRQGKIPKLFHIFGGYVLKYRRIPQLHGGLRARLRRWTGRAHPSENFPPWLAEDFVRKHHLRERWSTRDRADQSPHSLHPAGYAGLCSNFWASTFEQEDPAFTRQPLELRAPFLDQRVLRFLLRLPPIPWCMDKELLRVSMRGLLPDEVRLRPKTGLSQDALQLLAKTSRWQPALTNPTQSLSEFVDCPRASAMLPNSGDLWVDLRPLSLDLWLKNVEKASPIR
jgi:asparagine synthase (glutamine-hydrolysing)